MHITKSFHNGGNIAGVDARFKDFPGDGAVHFTGVDHHQSEAFGKHPGYSALARSSRPVDRNRNVVLVCDQSHDSSCVSVLSL